MRGFPPLWQVAWETRPRACLPVVATAVKWRKRLRDRASGRLPNPEEVTPVVGGNLPAG
ncbi:hypothetical protein [Dendronalium sp. ChiSLP03b]|uniref:hypothetical protein n=1 Tax=Dendronalium sp. ChiSLP03b TaxID=3075381 RepID=UPI002ADBC16D|nr:hypothetical protein [Dendronalium sp. ChiSLP03b]